MEKIAHEIDPRPPLRIHHILIWTAVVAVFVAVHMTLRRIGSLDGVVFALMDLVDTLPQALAMGVLMTGLLWRHRGLPFFDEAGHWLLLVLVVHLLQSTLQAILFASRWNASSPGAVDQLLWLGIEGIPPLAIGYMLLGPARRASDTIYWKLCCYSAGILALLPLYYFAFQFSARPIAVNYTYALWCVRLLAALGALACYVRAMRNDSRRHRSRHWSHWWGAALWAINVAIQATVDLLLLVSQMA